MSYQIRYYETDNGRVPFHKWLKSIRDKKTRHKIRAAIDRAMEGNLSCYKRLSNGIFELKLYFGPGYRIYFAFTSDNIILILWAGTKQTQKQDIIKAEIFYENHKKNQGVPYA